MLIINLYLSKNDLSFSQLGCLQESGKDVWDFKYNMKGPGNVETAGLFA